MKATDFELRHQALLHLLLIIVAFLTYLIQRDDVVWTGAKDSAHNRLLERILFALATFLIGAGAAMCTWVRMYPEHCLVGRSPADGRYGLYRYVQHPRYLTALTVHGST